MREARRVWTVEEFLRKVSSIREEWVAEEGDLPEWLPWFRGEANARWATRLKPRLYRREAARTKRHTRRLLYADQEIRLGFLRSAAQLVSGRALDKWERYFLMQAYGAPTRLLDWTDGALPALYFAVGSRGRVGDTAGDADAAVYMLDPWMLNQKTFSRGRRPQSEGVALSEWPQAARYLPDEFDSERLRPKIPLAIDPVHLAGRMAAQRAHFTIFGRDLDGLVSCSTRGRVCLVKIPIASAAISKIQEQLKLAGISASTLFPDMEGLGRELSYLWDELVGRIH